MSSKLSVGVHILAALALQRGAALTSGQIAGSVNTNPVVIRRLLGLLREAGYVESRNGIGGGWVLVTDPESITLLDVFRAVEPPCEVFALHKSPPNQLCPLGCNIQGVLMEVYAEAWEAMSSRLSTSTIASIVDTLKQRM